MKTMGVNSIHLSGRFPVISYRMFGSWSVFQVGWIRIPTYWVIVSGNLESDLQHCSQGLNLAPSYRRSVFLMYCNSYSVARYVVVGRQIKFKYSSDSIWHRFRNKIFSSAYCNFYSVSFPVVVGRQIRFAHGVRDKMDKSFWAFCTWF